MLVLITLQDFDFFKTEVNILRLNMCGNKHLSAHLYWKTPFLAFIPSGFWVEKRKVGLDQDYRVRGFVPESVNLQRSLNFT
jgi:hypothetical protein